MGLLDQILPKLYTLQRKILAIKSFEIGLAILQSDSEW